MFCQKCGKEIPDQAKFCNYCGAQVTIAQTQTAPQQPVQQSDPPRKKGSAGRFILSVLVVLAAYYGVRYVTQTMLTGPKSSAAPSESTASSESSGLITVHDTSLLNSCTYGALYQDGYLTYGLTRLHIPGYSLVAGEGDETDYLISPDSTTVFNALTHLEIGGISYDASDKESILKSYSNSSDFSNASMIDFRKYSVDGFPVIRYIVKCTEGNLEVYMGELIACPSKMPNQTLRLCLQTLTENGYDEINRIFDTLEISSKFELSYEDTQTMGLNRITVK